MIQGLIDAEATARIGAERFEQTPSRDDAEQRDPRSPALNEGRRRCAQDPQTARGEFLPLDPRTSGTATASGPCTSTPIPSNRSK
jgi:hypothetical protein